MLGDGGDMERSTDRILTTHTGSLPRPQHLIEHYSNDTPGEPLQPLLDAAVTEVVRRQADTGIRVVNDGEFGKPTRSTLDTGAWWSYVYDRLSGYELDRTGKTAAHPAAGSKDRAQFGDFYRDDAEFASSSSGASRLQGLVCTSPVRYTGHDEIRRDLNNLSRAVGEVDVTEAFMAAASPATLQILPNRYYDSSEEYTWALAEAIREEYREIVEAGFILQIDDPALVDVYDWWFAADDDMSGYRSWAEFQIEALNHALEGIPEDRVRFHICWGSWHGPHSTDVGLADVVDLLLKVTAQAYVVEAGNVRHEHEWQVWRDVALPEGKILIPGVVSHATNVLEHPELVAQRILRYTNAVGRENVIAGTDCGLGGRVHPQLAWAKLRSLADGAELARTQSWS